MVIQVGFDGCSDYRTGAIRVDAVDMRSLTPQSDLLGRLISAAELRQRVISNNLANVNTPNYRRLDVDFEKQLANELSGVGHATAKPEVVETFGLTARADGNNVDIDREIGQMNKNAMLQQTYIQLLSNHLDQMRMAIQGS